MGISIIEILFNVLEDLFRGIIKIRDDVKALLKKDENTSRFNIFGQIGTALDGLGKTIPLLVELNTINKRLDNIFSVVPNWILQALHPTLEILLSLKEVNPHYNKNQNFKDNSNWPLTLSILDWDAIFPFIWERLFVAVDDWLEIRNPKKTPMPNHFVHHKRLVVIQNEADILTR